MDQSQCVLDALNAYTSNPNIRSKTVDSFKIAYPQYSNLLSFEDWAMLVSWATLVKKFKRCKEQHLRNHIDVVGMCFGYTSIESGEYWENMTHIPLELMPLVWVCFFLTQYFLNNCSFL